METRTLFIIGNGFDLAHGLRTSYMDFFHYLEELRLSYYPEYKFSGPHYFKDNEISQFLNHPVSIGIHSILNLNDPSKRNIWCSYFERVFDKKKSIETWIDFEKEMQAVIQEIDSESRQDSLKKKNSIDSFWFKMSGDIHYDNYPKRIYDILSTIRDKYYIPSIELEELSRKESALFLYDELRRYTFCFEMYLACIMPILPPKFSQHTSVPLSRFFEIDTKHNFLLSFNYTTTAEERYKISSLQYIHGKLRSPDELEAHMFEPDFQLSTPLILGFHSGNTNSDTNPTPFLFFEKFFQRILHETKDYIYDWINHSTQNRQFKTVIYGHSLDSSDGDFIKFIFEKSYSITVYYHEPAALPSLITNLVSIFGREEVNRIHSQGKLKFVSADTLKVPEPEVDYALT